jgi:hypothetical protein
MAFALKELVPALGQDQPDNLLGIFYAEYDALDEAAKALRAEVVKVVQSFERKPVHTAADAYRLLSDGHLPHFKGAWGTVALSAERERIYIPTASGGMRMLKTRTRHLPRPDYLDAELPVPDGGGYLVVWGGDASVLTERGVAERLAALCAEVAVIDVLFWSVPDDGSGVTCWSLRAEAGEHAGQVVEFPDLVALAVARGGWS